MKRLLIVVAACAALTWMAAPASADHFQRSCPNRGYHHYSNPRVYRDFGHGDFGRHDFRPRRHRHHHHRVSPIHRLLHHIFHH